MDNTASCSDLVSIGAHFELPGPVVAGERYGNGHIHGTYAVTCDDHGRSRRFIFQHINHSIFKNVDQLMNNIFRVTSHLHDRIAAMPGHDPDREALRVISTRDGQTHLQTEEGEYWRVYIFVEDSTAFDVVEQDSQARQAARAYASFQQLLEDLPGPSLHQTIPDFHNTPKRVAALESAAREDVCGRLAECRPELEFAMQFVDRTAIITDALACGDVPLRVTHNDTKLNNVLLDNTTGEGICVIDLDTVMPGSMLYDFGDQVRTMVGRFEEQEADLSKVHVDLVRFEQLVLGLFDVSGALLTETERDLLPMSGLLMTYEVGIRFLTDYLQGDVYFKTDRPGLNLARARTQLGLVESIKRNLGAMEDVVGRRVND